MAVSQYSSFICGPVFQASGTMVALIVATHQVKACELCPLSAPTFNPRAACLLTRGPRILARLAA